MEKQEINNEKDWEYLAEGNANIILRYVGTDPSLKGKLLRLSKSNLKEFKANPETLKYEILFNKYLRSLSNISRFFYGEVSIKRQK